jgi:NAD(P)-dependent dehydrogenase (short-subunit alcohol dehydrogenase family)
MKNLTRFAIAGAAGAGAIAWNLNRRRSWMDFHRKVVLITGGSRGLGLQVAREFGSRGATIAICARDSEELEAAKKDLAGHRVAAHSWVCDVSESNAVGQMINQITQKLGPVDVLVNNAGIIRVGPLGQQTIEDFEEAMNTMFWGNLYPTLAVLPSMRERKDGRIVNITSIGGKVSIPHLLPYSCAKFAAMALSEGLRAELAGSGVRVVTIVPGLMRTGSHLRAEFKGNHKQEFAWFSAGAASPFVSIGAERAARSIVRAAARGDAEKLLSLPAGILARLHGNFPGFTSDVASLLNRLLLPNSPDSVTGIQTGAQVQTQLNSRLLEALNRSGQRAAESLNEV